MRTVTLSQFSNNVTADYTNLSHISQKADVEELNRRAARAIFRENNAHRDEYTIDLHGLFVKVKKINQKYCVKGCENSSTRVPLGQEDQATGRGERFMEPWKKMF